MYPEWRMVDDCTTYTNVTRVAQTQVVLYLCLCNNLPINIDQYQVPTERVFTLITERFECIAKM